MHERCLFLFVAWALPGARLHTPIGESTAVQIQWPRLGEASLSPSLLDMSVSSGAPQQPSERMRRLRHKLRQQNASISIFAIGASNTAMFARRCFGRPCYSSSQTQRQRGADWLQQLVDVLHLRFPDASIQASSDASGGMTAETVAACADQRLRCPLPNSGAVTVPTCHDLIILEFASVFFDRSLSDIEALLHRLQLYDTAVILLNFPNWCGTLNSRERHAQRCHERMAHSDWWTMHAAGQANDTHRRLAQLASWYDQRAASMYHALQPLLAAAAVWGYDIRNITDDGVHPNCNLHKSNIPCLYTTWTADVLAHTIDPTLLTSVNAEWIGTERILLSPTPHSPQTSVSPTFPPKPRFPSSYHARPPLFMSQGVNPIGVRCYGTVNGRQRGLKRLLHAAVGTPIGWAMLHSELSYNTSISQWEARQTASIKMPGFTSVTNGDTLMLQIDTTTGTNRHRGSSNTSSQLKLTYLESYEQAGVVHISCHETCTCSAQSLDTLNPDSRYALMKSYSFDISQHPSCKLQLQNVSPGTNSRDLHLCPTRRGPCTKLKVAGLAILASS